MTQTELLLDALEYYTVDPVGRRCVDGENTCRYSPYSLDKEETSQGCLIGRLLNPELAKKIDDEIGDINIDSLISGYDYTLPEYMNMNNARFLRSCQDLHDIRRNWTETGLSESGQGAVLDIIDEYNLDRKLFSKFLN